MPEHEGDYYDCSPSGDSNRFDPEEVEDVEVSLREWIDGDLIWEVE